MGLIITATESKKIEAKGFDGAITELESVYARLEFVSRPDGKSIETAFPYTFLTKEAYKLQAPIVQTNIPQAAAGEVLEQSLFNAHKIAADYLTAQGFEVEIDI
jgi:hypothetical protein